MSDTVAQPSRPGLAAGAPRLAFAGVFTATLLGFLGVGATLAVLPRYLEGPVGAGDVTVGVVIGIMAVTALLGRPVAGRLVDSGGRKRVMLVGLCASGVSGSMLLVDDAIAWLILCRLLLGFADGWIFTSGLTWIIDLMPEERRGQFIGFYGLSIWGGLTLGSAIGEGLYQWISYDAVWIMCATTPFLGVLVASRVPDRLAPPRVEGQPRNALVPRPAIRPGLALAFSTLGYSAMASFVVLHLEDKGVDEGAIVYTVFAASVIGTRLTLGSVIDRFGSVRTVSISVVCEAVGLLLIALAGSWPVAMAGAVLGGMGFSLLFPALALLVMTATSEKERGAAIGAFTAFFDLGMGIGAPIAGAIASLTSYETAFIVASGVALAAGAVSVAGNRAARPAAAAA